MKKSVLLFFKIDWEGWGFQNLTSLGPKFKVDMFKLAGFRNPASLGPNLCGFETLQVNKTFRNPASLNLQGFVKFTSLGPNL